MIPKYVALLFAILAAAPVLAAEPDQYGSMSWYEDLPSVLFLTGEIETGDSFELRRAMRDQEIHTLVTASRGGNLYEGLQIAAIIHDNEIATYLPDGLSCESACSMIYLGGATRMALGEIGVHQFYSGAPDSTASGRKDLTTAATQYTTAEIIGILNEFDTPPFVYEKMFSTEGMYYFKAAERARLNRNAEEPEFLEVAAHIDTFVAENPMSRPAPAVEPPSPLASAPATRAAPTPPMTPARAAEMPNTDFFGADLSSKGIRNISLSECSERCRNTSGCAAFSYVLEKRWCWQKSRVENRSYAPGVISGVYRWEHVEPGLLDRPFFEISANDLRGYDIFPKGLRNMSLDQCREACAGSRACVAYSWLIEKNWCFPKYGVGQMVPQTGTISGVHKSQF